MAPAEERAIAVLDVGKTNVKAALFDRDGSILAERGMPNRVVGTGPYPHADVDAIWAFALAALRELDGLRRIGDLVVTTHGASGALVGDDGLVLPVMDYEWDGPATLATYDAQRPPFSETFSPPMPVGLNLARQVAWQQDHRPEAFARARWLLAYPQYWSWRLSGVAATEVTSLGCHTDLWAPFADRPSSLVERRGWVRLLPPRRDAWDVLGPVTPEVAAATGLAPDVRVRVGIHDSNASLLPHLADTPAPFTVVSTGTWVILMAVGAPLAALDPAADMLVNVAASGAPVPTARFMGGREYAALAGEGASLPDLADIEAVIRAGTLAVPCFSPQGGPYAAHAGRIEGPSPGTPEGRAALATLYSALMTDDLLNRLGATAGPLVVEGRFASNPAFGALLAALRPDQQVLAAPDTAGTALGAALLASWPSPQRVAARHLLAPATLDGLAACRERWRSLLPR
ncbi:sugar kinase [uncultured Alsobacter sp.]|uniref:FGGY-family carbohydrate kinase n=1 Tax=uncultured Alsobacter sp. TaxID=1748258 RepID=UPI0025F082CE|nr:sugar kinase [uncultured Alsobacter sp.]